MQTKHLCILIYICTKGEVGVPWNPLKPSSKLFYWPFQCDTVLRIICVIYVLCLSCFHVCSLLPCGHLKGRADLLALVCDVYWDFGSSPFCILGQVSYLIVSIPDPCCLSYFMYLCLPPNKILIIQNKFRCPNTLSLVSFAGMTLDKCIVLRIGTLTGCPLCRESHPLCRLKNPTTVISIWLLVGFHPATRSVQSTPADNTRKRVWQYIEKESL